MYTMSMKPVPSTDRRFPVNVGIATARSTAVGAPMTIDRQPV